MDLPDNVQEYLRFAREYGASDLHLTTGARPHWRLNGYLSAIWEEAPIMDLAKTEACVESLITDKQKALLDKDGHLDFSYSDGPDRYRASVVKHRQGYGLVFRVVSGEIKNLAQLGIDCKALVDLCQYQNGIILVTGSMGSGKSTTLAALVDYINQNRKEHILTLEDPVEFVFESVQSQINQREIPTHSESFSRALRASLREDPDVIMVGEMRDLETISLALTAAETGHLVIATLHTANAIGTLDRIMDAFPAAQRDQIRVMLAESLRGIFCQQLIPRIDGESLVVAHELLLNNMAVANCIREGKTFMLRGIMQIAKNEGMVLMDETLMNLRTANLISEEEFRARLSDVESYTS